VRSKTVTRHLPPRPLRGRWGSATAAESFLLQAGIHELPSAFAAAVVHRIEQPIQHARTTEVLDPDIDAESYSATQGRWARDASAGLSNKSFWCTLLVASMSRQPSTHLHYWLQKYSSHSPDRGKQMVKFVCQVAAEIGAEWEGLLREVSNWAPLVNLLQDEPASPPAIHYAWVAEAVLSCCELYADYARRVLSKVTTFPWLLLWLVWVPHDREDPNRKACARSLLTLDEHQLEAQACTALKFRIVFRSALEDCANDGTLDETVYHFVECMAAGWMADTQEIEGLNNSIKHMVQLAPAISWSLMSSRITCQKHLASLRTKAERDEFLQSCIYHHQRTLAEPKDPKRWCELDLEDYPCAPSFVTPPPSQKQKKSKGKVCAAKALVAVKRLLKEAGRLWAPSAEVILEISITQNRGTASKRLYLPAVKHYSQLWAVRGQRVEACSATGPRMELMFPLYARDLLFIFQEAHDEFMEHNLGEADVEVSAVKLQWDLDSTSCASIVGEQALLHFSDVCWRAP
jgi:hypothetical protein